MLEALVPISTAMEMTGLSRSTLWRLEKKGKIKGTYWNGKKMYFKNDVTPMADRRKIK